jgi:hypothetical protein
MSDEYNNAAVEAALKAVEISESCDDSVTPASVLAAEVIRLRKLLESFYRKPSPHESSPSTLAAALDIIAQTVDQTVEAVTLREAGQSILRLVAENEKLRDGMELMDKAHSLTADRLVKVSVEAGEMKDQLMWLQEQTRWRPIATAPRNEWVLLYCPTLKSCVVGSETGRIPKFIKTDGFGIDTTESPTHWKPLPQPPEGKDGAK